jgi:hypothetical protein
MLSAAEWITTAGTIDAYKTYMHNLNRIGDLYHVADAPVAP